MELVKLKLKSMVNIYILSQFFIVEFIFNKAWVLTTNLNLAHNLWTPINNFLCIINSK